MEANFECQRPMPLGAESGALLDTQFSATSYAHSREPYKARLNGRYGTSNKLND